MVYNLQAHKTTPNSGFLHDLAQLRKNVVYYLCYTAAQQRKPHFCITFFDVIMTYSKTKMCT